MRPARHPQPVLPDHLVVVGANHRSSPALLRDRIFVPDNEAPRFLADLRREGMPEAQVLSTCDRVEVQAIHPDIEKAGRIVRHGLARRANLPPHALDTETYNHAGEDALRHVFAVAGSLDSQVVGEPQVLGQVKAAHGLARKTGAAGAGLVAVMEAAFATAKRVRTETRIAEGPVSMAASAVQVARGIHGDLAGVGGLLLGAGDMGELIAEHMLAAGLGPFTVCVPDDRRADELARRFECHIAPFDRFAAAASEAGVVVSAIGGREYIVTEELVRGALDRRRRRPMFFVDAAIPGDVAPGVERLDGAFAYDLGELERHALSGRAGRNTAAGDAWRIVDDEVAAFVTRRRGRDAGGAITQLRAHFEAARAEILDETPPAVRDAADAVTRRLVNRLLHDPSEALRSLSAEAPGPEKDRAEAVLRRLFGLADKD